MDWASRIRQAFTASGHAWDPDVVEELTQHAAATYDAARSEGLGHDQATRRVDLQIETWGREATLLDRRPRRRAAVTPPAVRSAPLAGLLHDVSYALRLMLRRPGFTAVTVVTMALGIGATTALFSVADGVLMRPLPWPEGDRLVRLTEAREGGTNRFGSMLTNATYLAWREEPDTLEGLAAWGTDTQTLTGAGDPERVDVAHVTASLFPLLRAHPLLGTLFDGEQEPVLVLSHGLWQRHFAGDPRALGQHVMIDGESFRVVGVMPREFVFPDTGTEAWLPYPIGPVLGEDPDNRQLSMFHAIGRLRHGVTPAQVAAEGTARGRGAPDLGMVGIAVFGTDGPVTVSAVPWLEALTADVRPAIAILLVAVGLLLGTAAANVANLQLAGATSRRRELAIRAALGAGGARIGRQLLVENVLLGLCGGLLGLLLAVALHRVLPALLPAGFPRLDNVGIDLRVLLFALVVSLSAGLVLGLIPALRLRRADLVASMAENGRAATGVGMKSPSGRARAVIMAAQVAIACILLIGGSLLGRTLLALIHADRGYDPSHVLTASLLLPEAEYSPERRADLLDALRERLRAHPGVRHAAFTSVLPLTGGDSLMGLTLPGPDPAAEPVRAQTAVRMVSPDYFAALGVRIISGRGFTDEDRLAARPAVIVNQTFARRYLGNRPLARELPVNGDDLPDAPVIGVVDDVRHGDATSPYQAEIYICSTRRAGGYRPPQAHLVVRTSSAPERLAPTLRSLLREADENLVVEGLITMENRVLNSVSRSRLYALLLGGFAVFAAAIAGVGLFGVLSYSVAQRTREIGVRGALGARPVDIVRLVVGQGLAITIAGLVAGGVASLWLVSLLENLLYGVPPRDALSFVAVLAILLLLTLVACVVPARRAARIDPQQVLRGS